MLLIVEGLDRSGKTTLVNLVREQLSKHIQTVLIRKSYDERLYPINYSIAQTYDWQAILDRLVLANPDVLFIADRSFITQTAFQLVFGSGEHAQTDEQRQMFDNYCKVCEDACIVYCMSDRFELDGMIQSIHDRTCLDACYVDIVSTFKHNMLLDMDNQSLATTVNNVVQFVLEHCTCKH